jgi:hypothetical protein
MKINEQGEYRLPDTKPLVRRRDRQDVQPQAVEGYADAENCPYRIGHVKDRQRNEQVRDLRRDLCDGERVQGLGVAPCALHDRPRHDVHDGSDHQSGKHHPQHRAEGRQRTE